MIEAVDVDSGLENRIQDVNSRTEEVADQFRDLAKHPQLLPSAAEAFTRGLNFIEFPVGLDTCRLGFGSASSINSMLVQVHLFSEDFTNEEHADIEVDRERRSSSSDEDDEEDDEEGDFSYVVTDESKRKYSTHYTINGHPWLSGMNDENLAELDVLEQISDFGTRIKASLDAQQNIPSGLPHG